MLMTISPSSLGTLVLVPNSHHLGLSDAKICLPKAMAATARIGVFFTPPGGSTVDREEKMRQFRFMHIQTTIGICHLIGFQLVIP